MTTQTITLSIEGMTCGGCVKSVTNALNQVAGVQAVDVSLVTITTQPSALMTAKYNKARLKKRLKTLALT